MIENCKIDGIYCGFKNRILAFLIDFLCVLLIAINLNLYIFTPLVNNGLKINDLEEKYYDDLLVSGLYYQKDGSYLLISNDSSKLDHNFTSDDEYFNYLDNSLNNFYNNSLYSNISITAYNESKYNNDNLFYYDMSNNTFSFASNYNYDDMVIFFKNEVNIAKNLLENQDFVLNKYIKILSYRLMALLISFSICMVIFYLIIPLVNKKGQTLGKYLFSIGVMDNNTKQFISKNKTILRFILIYFEYVLGFISCSAMFLISFAFSIFSKNNYTLHDFITKTVDIDLKTSTYNKKIELKEQHNGKKKF